MTIQVNIPEEWKQEPENIEKRVTIKHLEK
jgi:hypothetical protein